MPTAKGKITTARLASGHRVLVTKNVGGGWSPSYTKVKGAEVAIVTSIKPVKVGRSTGRRVAAKIGDESIAMEVGASQTFWLAPKEGTVTTATATRKSSAKPAPAPARPKKATTAKATAPKATAPKATAPKDAVDFTKATVRNRIVKEHEAGSTIKEIAEGLGLPAEHRSWFRVSKVWREEADARGLKRPRRSK